MDQNQILSPALRSKFSEFLSQAVMLADLPPLTGERDQEFLGDVLEVFIDAFWEAYVNQLDESAQKNLLAADEDETGEKMVEWMKKNADFENDEAAKKLSIEIVEDFATRLPDVISQMHSEFLKTEK
ncbi:hypothetical protein HOF56_02770 [Candidatus Peribacteria bacterium]|jgi:hypothetical protein|nr:hypothetical protein [Candidatus Peribacteria bacterium]MBT4020905.1 hypothetical protein [Candidatus Peribacteria bacterium]MBT4241092.1 hypothetical protein [Candidatus Peribacteria bacterium]MBT4474342.1 hypothetical protein [Candidatus Peribacteria bacterium]